MKIIPETDKRGTHSVLFLSENPRDVHICKQMFDMFRRHGSVRPTLQQSEDADFHSLVLEERE